MACKKLTLLDVFINYCYFAFGALNLKKGSVWLENGIELKLCSNYRHRSHQGNTQASDYTQK